jgi:predicted PurR-regulated permease PerM
VTVKTVLTVALTALALGLLLYALSRAGFAFSITLLSTILAVAFDHGVVRLQQRGLRRMGAVTLVMLAFVAGVAGILLVIIPPAVNQARALGTQWPQLVKSLRHSRLYERVNQRVDLDQMIDRASKEAPARLANAIGPGLKAVADVVHGVAGVIAAFFLVIFMLLYGGPLVRALLGEAVPDRRDRYERMLLRIYRSIGSYLSGLSFICLVNAVIATLMLAIIRVPVFLPLGILSGLSSLVPLVGNTLVGATITVIAFFAVGPWRALASGIFFILYQQFENHLLAPVIYKRAVQLNPLVVALALLFFTELAGIGGAVVAVPTMAAGQIVLHEVLLFRREKLGLPIFGPTVQRTD